MAGLFQVGGSKPGKGIDPDAYESRLHIFFDVFIRKFWRLVRLNLVYVLFSIPLIVALYFLSPVGLEGDQQVLATYLYSIGALVYVSVVGIGFVAPGHAYVLRNFARQTHAWVEQDFMEQIKKNWKQGLALTGIDLLAVAVVIFNLNYYTNIMEASVLSAAIRWMVIVFAALYFMMHFYLYQMMVTFDMPLREMLRNALILTIAHLPRNVLVLAGAVVIAAITFSIGTLIGLVLTVFIAPTLIGYLVNFMAEPIIKKYMIDPQNQEDE